MLQSNFTLEVSTYVLFLAAVVLRVSLGSWTTTSTWFGLFGLLGLLLLWLRLG